MLAGRLADRAGTQLGRCLTSLPPRATWSCRESLDVWTCAASVDGQISVLEADPPALLAASSRVSRATRRRAVFG